MTALCTAFLAADQVDLAISRAHDTDILQVDVFTLKKLLGAPSLDYFRQLAEVNTRRGVIAGDLLAALYVMDRFKVPEPSFNKALYVAQRYAEEESYGGGSKLSLSERKIREYWAAFKPVAHFWAAIRLNEVYRFTKGDNVFLSRDFPIFLEVAVELLNFGCSFIPMRAKPKTPILDVSQCWQLPVRISPRELISKRPPDRLLRYLKDYKVPTSSNQFYFDD
jgi:hypothetical protein